ncbi:hypothetical protein B0H66DRAFT_495935 [Apodospora peruviana]|uniref:WD-like domain-containing protein n=1 Tax=Apodospora peruviana TaxID=516989 RepID=A0AAE0ID87_9PEZI|nr:hypothetical protein B0H66DRAFT_495935 [Apodospora peruviana]
MFLKSAVLATLLSAVHVLGVPTSLSKPGDDSLIITKTLELAEGRGTLTIYGSNPAFAGSSNATDVQLARRCGSNEIHCDGKHVPALNTCSLLIENVRTSGLTLNSSPRAVCLNRNNKDCCISWSSDIGSVHELDLYSAAKSSLDRCVTENNSGRATDVAINGHCLNQCLSDRATGCK